MLWHKKCFERKVRKLLKILVCVTWVHSKLFSYISLNLLHQFQPQYEGIKFEKKFDKIKRGSPFVFFRVFHESTQITSMSDVLKEHLMGILGIGNVLDSTHLLGCCDTKKCFERKVRKLPKILVCVTWVHSKLFSYISFNLFYQFQPQYEGIKFEKKFD